MRERGGPLIIVQENGKARERSHDEREESEYEAHAGDVPANLEICLRSDDIQCTGHCICEFGPTPGLRACSGMARARNFNGQIIEPQLRRRRRCEIGLRIHFKNQIRECGKMKCSGEIDVEITTE